MSHSAIASFLSDNFDDFSGGGDTGELETRDRLEIVREKRQDDRIEVAVGVELRRSSSEIIVHGTVKAGHSSILTFSLAEIARERMKSIKDSSCRVTTDGTSSPSCPEDLDQNSVAASVYETPVEVSTFCV